MRFENRLKHMYVNRLDILYPTNSRLKMMGTSRDELVTYLKEIKLTIKIKMIYSYLFILPTGNINGSSSSFTMFFLII